MHAVPSVVGTGSVVAAAAVGLVFAQPAEPTSPRPASNKRKLTLDYGSLRSFSRPATSATASVATGEHASLAAAEQHPPLPLSPTTANIARPSPFSSTTQPQTTPPKVTARRPSFARHREGVPPLITESLRDSVSSNGSWMRRLSIRPLSQQGSPRSSLGPDSPSLKSFNHTYSGPALSPVPPSPSHLAPNKLVKRNPPSTQPSTPGTLSKRSSRSHIPSLRRPATSHQRSATIAQLHSGETLPDLPKTTHKYSLDQQFITSPPSRTPLELTEEEGEAPSWNWTSFFHSRVLVSLGRKGSQRRASESSPDQTQIPRRSLHVRRGSMPRPYLVNTAMMPASPEAANFPTSPVTGAAASRHFVVADPASPRGGASGASVSLKATDSPAAQSTTANPGDTPSKRPRRSLSMHFGSPGWISKSGSLRRPKRGGSSQKSGGTRNVSAPVRTTSPIEPQIAVKQDFVHSSSSSPPTFPEKADDPSLSLPMEEQPSSFHSKRSASRQRNTSSPLPPLSRLSSFGLDLYRLGTSSPPATSPLRPDQHMTSSQSLQASPILASPPRFPLTPHSRDVSNERASTLAGSDLEMPALTSTDDDDTDFKSETMFDSLRTIGSIRVRNMDSPLESMFDDSPPSTASKSKRLSIQEILARSWDGETRIMEEDEDAATPIRVADSPRSQAGFGMDQDMVKFDSVAAADLSLSGRDLSRMSLDDDDDFDWARDDENAGFSNQLSPPMTSMNSRGSGPSLRTALATISGNSNYDFVRNDAASDRPERPRSNVFDWSEPSSHEWTDADGQYPRPKTVHGKQELDARGGRASSRKGPVVAHIRSQSVPVVPDLPELSKTTAKFRTWASGPMNISEDWEDDFDFEEDPVGLSEGKPQASTVGMVVPASIQATQPTVKAHSCQIRELSLLVNGLKRLCRHGKDLGLLHESAELWLEAENIIKLASPDEEEEDEEAEKQVGNADRRSVSPESLDERYTEEGFDSDTVSYREDGFDLPEPDMAKMAVVRERQVIRRRSVFAPDDDIFGGNWPMEEDSSEPSRTGTPANERARDTPDSALIASVMEAMQQQQRRSSSAPIKGTPKKAMGGTNSRLFFDTNSLQELVKKANVLFHNLSDIVRRAELITQSPASTPKRDRHLRHDGSPAFTRVFTDPSAVPTTPPKSHRLPQSQSGNSISGGARASVDSRASNGNGISQRLQMMTVS